MWHGNCGSLTHDGKMFYVATVGTLPMQLRFRLYELSRNELIKYPPSASHVEAHNARKSQQTTPGTGCMPWLCPTGDAEPTTRRVIGAPLENETDSDGNLPSGLGRRTSWGTLVLTTKRVSIQHVPENRSIKDTLKNETTPLPNELDTAGTCWQLLTGRIRAVGKPRFQIPRP